MSDKDGQASSGLPGEAGPCALEVIAPSLAVAQAEPEVEAEAEPEPEPEPDTVAESNAETMAGPTVNEEPKAATGTATRIETRANGDIVDPAHVRALRRTSLIVVALNVGFFLIEVGIALAIGSVSLFADSVDFLEDAAINMLVFFALGWTLQRRAKAGKVMAVIIAIPALAAVVMAVIKFYNPEAPDPVTLVITSGGAIVVNIACTWLLARHRDNVGSMSKAAFLAARNDIYSNAAIIAMGVLTMLWRSGWPDIVLGLFLVVLNFASAKEVWELADQEQLAARALAGEIIDDD